MKYYATVGLEIHAELKTATKMFCSCKNDSDEKNPNVNICPGCTGHPGALPVINKKAGEHVVKVGLALDGKVADFTEFDRKNYFYPDIPKGYQISHYKFPIVSGGHLAGFDITRVHLEEDTATNKHVKDYSLVDFNRAGVPLMELVTEPHVFEGGKEAAENASKFAKELQLVLWYLDVSEANMEKGEMRVEANISVSPDRKKFGTKVEVKNLNSFRSVERAIKYELERMGDLLEEGKETSHDYRYFPDPDLSKMKLHEAFDLKKMQKELPELPEGKRKRYKRDFEIKEEDTEIFVNEPALGLWFEGVAKILGDAGKIKTASNYITSDLLGLQKSNLEARLPSAENFAELINLVTESKISSRGAKDILARMVINSDISPLKIAADENLLQQSDEGALKKIARKVIDANPKVVADYKSGKDAALQSLVGQVMKETKGSANPRIAKEILVKLIK